MKALGYRRASESLFHSIILLIFYDIVLLTYFSLDFSSFQESIYGMLAACQALVLKISKAKKKKYGSRFAAKLPSLWRSIDLIK